MDFSCRDIAQTIDHALLSPTLTDDALQAGCQLAMEYEVASVCTMPFHLAQCVQMLAGSSVRASTTIGFPHGVHTTSVKRAEAEQALDEGGQELDLVINPSRALSGGWNYVRDEIAAILELTHAAGQKLKVIFENCYLNQQQKIRLCQIGNDLQVDWIKTSTGFGSSGATVEDVRLMAGQATGRVEVKAAGGIRDLDTLLALRAAGATRIGISRTAELLDACRRRLDL